MILLLFAFINILLAYIDATLIKRGQHINHAFNALFYSLLLIFAFLSGASILQVIAVTVIRIPVFNTALNIFRGLRYDYVSEHPESIIDQLANPIIETFGYDNYNLFLILISILLNEK